mmetsp:Transcript_123276/g.343238  ORF Transcript_123276/g.343238 Transcript_123276/m.343238 type:complete len:179 (+) Transcript_123276:511-1047(+)
MGYFSQQLLKRWAEHQTQLTPAWIQTVCEFPVCQPARNCFINLCKGNNHSKADPLIGKTSLSVIIEIRVTHKLAPNAQLIDSDSADLLQALTKSCCIAAFRWLGTCVEVLSATLTQDQFSASECAIVHFAKACAIVLDRSRNHWLSQECVFKKITSGISLCWLRHCKCANFIKYPINV